MKRILFYLAIILILGMACKNPNQKQNILEKPDEAYVISDEYETKSGKYLLFMWIIRWERAFAMLKLKRKGF